MIIDCFTHTWESPRHLGTCVPPTLDATQGHDAVGLNRAGAACHLAAADPTDVTIVLGFHSHYLGAEISNDHVAAYVRKHPTRLVGFAGIDPAAPNEAIAEIGRAQNELGMPGIAVAPAAQDFHPSNSQAMRVYAAAAQRNMPIVFHPGVFIASPTKLEYAQPVLLDEVAREFADLKIIIAHMGYPWMHEVTVLLGKHPNVFTETSWLLHHPWQAYQALLEAYEYGVMDKILFGSGFPASSASVVIEELFSIAQLYHGTNLTSVPRDQLRRIVERDTLSLLGIPNPAPPALREPVTVQDEFPT
jgi:hypothetical protein